MEEITQIILKNGKPIFRKTIKEENINAVSHWFLGSSFKKMSYTLEIQWNTNIKGK